MKSSHLLEGRGKGPPPSLYSGGRDVQVVLFAAANKKRFIRHLTDEPLELLAPPIIQSCSQTSPYEWQSICNLAENNSLDTLTKVSSD